MVTQRELALQMLAQLRLLDPSISAEIGTPERKIIDTVAQSLSDSQIDLEALGSALDIDSKYGAALDRFFRIFGFTRQTATFATGYVTFSRLAPSNFDIRIPAGTTVEASVPLQETPNTIGELTTIRFATIYDVILPAGSLTVVAAIRSTIAGTIGNVAADLIADLTGSSVFGITGATNELPTAGGINAESDDEFKVRFRNTIFRNLAGTQDQYMALAVSTPFTSKVNVVGPQSRYKEYIQVPPVADNASYDVGGVAGSEVGGGNPAEYTTALSTIPFAKYIYATEVPTFVSNREIGISSLFYRQDYDFTINTSIAAKNRGDTYRFGSAGLDWSFFGTFGLTDTPTARPNVTFKSVYVGANADITAIRPGDVVLFDFAYMSEASRNDITRNITNAVDVFIDGGNEVSASTIIPRPANTNLFIDDPASKFHYENYRRVGEPTKRPNVGNILTPLFWEPVLSVPEKIVIGTDTFYRGTHYWAVEDVSSIGGTVRARSGIEWATLVYSQSQTDAFSADPSTYTGRLVHNSTGDPSGGQSVEVTGYTYDKNVVDLQAALEGAKQVTTDVLAHRAKKRYFKLDVTVMYVGGAAIDGVNAQIRNAVDTYLKTQYFGTYIQLSDLLNVIHNVSGVDNVRWSNDAPGNTVSNRVYECDINGNPLTNVTVDRFAPGSSLTNAPIGLSPHIEQQRIFVTGNPTGGTWTVAYAGNVSAPLAYNADASTIQAAITGAPLSVAGTTVTLDARTTAGVKYPIRSYRVDFTGNVGRPALVTDASLLTGGDYLFSNDFFLRDDELAQLPTGATATDTVAGLIIRPRAQNTWSRSS